MKLPKENEQFKKGYWDGISCMTNNQGNKTARSILRYKPINEYERGKVYAAIDWLVKNGCRLSQAQERRARLLGYL